MGRLRHRLGRWLLGYEPFPLPDGVYIVWRQERMTVTITASSLKMDLTSRLRSYEELEVDLAAGKPFHSGPHGTFSGTIGATD